MFKKRLFGFAGRWAAFALAAVLVLSACSGGDGGPEGTASESAGGKVKLTVATWAGAEELKEFEEVLDKVNGQAEDYVIEVQSIPADYYQKLQTMIAGKQAPDFMWLSQEYVAQYASLGAIAPLDEHLGGIADYKADDYYEGALNVGKFEDKQYALPWISQPYMLYYNEDMFKEAGVEPPKDDWSWEDFMEAGKKLTKDGQYGALLNVVPTAMFTWSYGGDTFDRLGNILLKTPESKQGLKMYQTIVQSGIAPARAQAETMGNADMFKTGKVAMFIGGAGDDFEKTVKFKVGMVLPPRGTKQATFSWIGLTAMSSKTDNKAVAAKALVDMTNAIHKWKVVAPTKSGIDRIKTSRPEKEYAVETIREASEFARGFNNRPQQAEIDTAIWEHLTQPIEKGEDIDKVVENTINKLLEIVQKK